MPEYTFKCSKCNLPFTDWHGMDAAHPRIHPGCGGILTRVFHPTPVIYKHSGFFTTDKVLSEPEKE